MEMNSASGKTQQATEATLKLWPALLGLFLFAFTFRSSSGAYLLGLITLMIWLAASKRPSIPALPRLLITVSQLYLLVLVAHMLWTLALNEYELTETLEGYRHFAELLLFIPFSAVIYHCRAYWLQLLWVPVLAVVIRVLHRTDFTSLDTTLFDNSIYGFGQHHVTFGMQAMLTILTVAALATVSVSRFSTATKRAVAIVLTFSVAALLLQSLITSGSRSAWGCLLIGLLTLGYCNRKKISAMGARKKVLITMAFMLMGTALISKNIDRIERRLVNETAVNFNFTLAVDELPRDKDLFFARRVHLAYFGWENWLERPLLGHGPASVRPLLAADSDFNIHPHLHNTYIQVLMELGLLGSFALLALWAVLAGYLWQKRPPVGTRYRPLYNLITASMLSLAVWSVAGFHLHSSDWRFIFVWYTAFAGFLIRQAYAAEPAKEKKLI